MLPQIEAQSWLDYWQITDTAATQVELTTNQPVQTKLLSTSFCLRQQGTPTHVPAINDLATRVGQSRHGRDVALRGADQLKSCRPFHPFQNLPERCPPSKSRSQQTTIRLHFPLLHDGLALALLLLSSFLPISSFLSFTT